VSHPRTADLEALLDRLSEAGVEFIIVGGAAAVLHGAPVTTQDLDIVHERSPANVARLLGVLERLDAVFRPVTAGPLRRPTAALLAGTGQLNLSTSLGPLDPLGALHDGKGYEELVAHTEQISDGALTLRVLDLPTLIAVKASTGRAKDKLVVPILLALQRSRAT
jgi:hypothetical protein